MDRLPRAANEGAALPARVRSREEWSTAAPRPRKIEHRISEQIGRRHADDHGAACAGAECHLPVRGIRQRPHAFTRGVVGHEAVAAKQRLARCRRRRCEYADEYEDRRHAGADHGATTGTAVRARVRAVKGGMKWSARWTMVAFTGTKRSVVGSCSWQTPS